MMARRGGTTCGRTSLQNGIRYAFSRNCRVSRGGRNAPIRRWRLKRLGPGSAPPSQQLVEFDFNVSNLKGAAIDAFYSGAALTSVGAFVQANAGAFRAFDFKLNGWTLWPSARAPLSATVADSLIVGSSPVTGNLFVTAGASEP